MIARLPSRCGRKESDDASRHDGTLDFVFVHSSAVTMMSDETDGVPCGQRIHSHRQYCLSFAISRGSSERLSAESKPFQSCAAPVANSIRKRGLPVTRSGAVPTSIVPQMAAHPDRKCESRPSMRNTLASAVIWCAGVALCIAQQPQTFRSDVQTVAVFATVQDRDGRLVPDLTKNDFKISDNGRLVPIATFSHEIQPITVALMLDMSDSMRMDYTRVRDSAAHFVDVLLPADRVRIGTFGHDVAMSPYLTGDRNILHRILREELWISHFTALWTAVDVAMDSLEHEPGRRVVLVLSDGQNFCKLSIIGSETTGCVDRQRVTKHALAGEFMIYAIGMPSEGLSSQLIALADETGGGHFTVSRHADLGATFERVAEELHSQYLLGFSPASLDGNSHKLEVTVTRHGLTSRARKSYIAERK